MAVMSVRALLRDAAAVFRDMEQDGQPVLITRRGRPVAALVPVDSEQAEALILSSAPELIESRHRAENAIAEGRTTPLETALQDLDAEEAAPTIDMEATAKATSGYGYLVSEVGHRLPELTYLLGADRAEQVNQIAKQRAREITLQVLNNAAEAGFFERNTYAELADRVEELNIRLFNLSLRRELIRDLLERLAAMTAGTTPLEEIANPAEGIVGKALTDTAIGEAATFVDAVNTDIIDDCGKRKTNLSPEIFEASLVGSVGALERSNPIRS
jgi:antitoxin (DNA-binding transcriptional repressor) of toxin-antitoxin stability system